MIDKNNISYKLYVVTDRSYLHEGETLVTAVEQAILGGATVIQLREKDASYDEFKATALDVQKVCKKYNVPLIINDNVALADEIEADGVHLGLTDMSITDARATLGEDAIIGATAKLVEMATDAELEGADYLGCGAVFGSDTKQDITTMTLEILDGIVNAVNIPVVAIGGINANNVSALRSIGIAGVAVCGGIFAHKNRIKATRDILCNLYSRPIVQCITNHVTTESVANMVLFFACSPIMSHNINEAYEVQANANGLYLNLGATDDYEAMKIAYKTALDNEHIIVIDPVGISGISYRREFLKELLGFGAPTCIRGNVSEIRALNTDADTSYGLESCDDNDLDALKGVVEDVANTFNTIVVASGVRDVISDGTTTVVIESGHAMQKQLTGSGCMLSAGICAALCMGNVNYAPTDNKNMIIVTSACQEIGDAACRAGEQTVADDKGIYSFKTSLFDELT